MRYSAGPVSGSWVRLSAAMLRQENRGQKSAPTGARARPDPSGQCGKIWPGPAAATPERSARAMNENQHLFAGNEAARRHLRDEFLRWQCRVRQWCVREEGGRPMPGMCPEVRLPDRDLGRIVVLLVARDSRTAAREFQHMVRKTLDPATRYTNALRMLGGDYYQRPDAFSDELTALFRSGATLPARVLRTGSCILDFAQSGARVTLPCALRELPESDPRFQATFWHNRLFNNAMPGDVTVILFSPDWARASQNLL